MFPFYLKSKIWIKLYFKISVREGLHHTSCACLAKNVETIPKPLTHALGDTIPRLVQEGKEKVHLLACPLVAGHKHTF